MSSWGLNISWKQEKIGIVVILVLAALFMFYILKGHGGRKPGDSLSEEEKTRLGYMVYNQEKQIIDRNKMLNTT